MEKIVTCASALRKYLTKINAKEIVVLEKTIINIAMFIFSVSMIQSYCFTLLDDANQFVV